MVAHDCVVATTLCWPTMVLLAGHVRLGVYLCRRRRRLSPVHARGEIAMVGGLARITLDIPALLMAAERDEIVGLNLVG